MIDEAQIADREGQGERKERKELSATSKALPTPH